jgi:hypothetical protein
MPRSYKRDKVKASFRWKGATIQRGLEQRSRGIATFGAIDRQFLVKTLGAGKDLVCALVNFKVWKLVMTL